MPITVVVTTFERDDFLKRCILSIPPGFRIIIQNTKGNLSWGRNEALSHVTTQYFLLMEDDMEFTAETYINSLVDILKTDRSLLGVGGHIDSKNKRHNWCHNFEVVNDERLEAQPSDEKVLKSNSGYLYRTCDLISNFVLLNARHCPLWDEELEIQEHIEWFYRVKNTTPYRFAFTEASSIFHNCNQVEQYSEVYRAKRNRIREFSDLASKKIGLKLGNIHSKALPLC